MAAAAATIPRTNPVQNGSMSAYQSCLTKLDGVLPTYDYLGTRRTDEIVFLFYLYQPRMQPGQLIGIGIARLHTPFETGSSFGIVSFVLLDHDPAVDSVLEPFLHKLERVIEILTMFDPAQLAMLDHSWHVISVGIHRPAV